MNHLLSFSYWISARPEPISAFSTKISLIIVVVLAFIGLASYLGRLNFIGISKRITKKITAFSFTNAVLLLLLVFFNYEIIPYLRARMLFLILLLEAIIWLFFIIFRSKKQVTNLSLSSRDQEIKKYLPS